MKLYSGPLSLFTAKVRIALDEKQLAYDRIEVGWSLRDRYLPHHPDVVALNPKRQVPVLVDGELAVYDSTLILEYLEDAYPEPPLYPREPAARARCRQLEAAADEILFPWIWNLIEEVFYPAPAGGRDGERRERAGAALSGHYAELDKQLAAGEYLCGRFSAADIGSFIMVSTAATLGVPADAGHAHLRAWLERCAVRPAVAREVEGLRAAAARAMAEARGASA
jgi:glutathione S-transferase